MDSKLKLQIVTALDNAGIKATQAQIDGLVKSISDVNTKGSADTKKLERALGEVPGRLGKIGGALGGIFATVTSIIGAYKLGVEIGEQISDFLKKHWEWYGNIFKDAERLKKEQERTLEVLKRQYEVKKEILDANAKVYEQQKKVHQELMEDIREETRARIQATTTRNNLLKNADNIQLLRLEKEEFRDATKMEDEGASQQELDQLHSKYDIQKKIMLLNQQQYQLDEKRDIILAKQNEKQRALDSYQTNVVKPAARALREAEKQETKAAFRAKIFRKPRNKQQFLKDHDEEEWKKKLKELITLSFKATTAKEKAKTNTILAERELRKLRTDYDAVGQELDVFDAENANIVGRSMFDLEKSAAYHDKLVRDNGDLLGFGYTEEFQKEIRERWKNEDVYQKVVERYLPIMAEKMLEVYKLK